MGASTDRVVSGVTLLTAVASPLSSSPCLALMHFALEMKPELPPRLEVPMGTQDIAVNVLMRCVRVLGPRLLDT
jgi:hypothetical protein